MRLSFIDSFDQPVAAFIDTWYNNMIKAIFLNERGSQNKPDANALPYPSVFGTEIKINPYLVMYFCT